MRGQRVIVGLILTVAVATTTPADELTAQPAPTPRGVVVDFRGPPEGVKLSIDYIFTLEGQKEPLRNASSYSGYSSRVSEGRLHSWRVGGYVVEKVGETQMRFLGLKGADGKIIPITGVKIESMDLFPGQRPTVVPDDKRKA